MSIPAQSRSAVCLARFLAFACLAALFCAPPARADEGVITPESAEGQNIANAADLLEKFGAVDVANRVRDRLKSGQYSYKTGMKHNAETGTGSQYTAISPEIIRLPGILRDKPFDPDKRFDMIFALARTLYHEDVHSGQGYFSSLWGELPGETTYETDAWSKTIAAETAWIMNGMVLRTLTPQQLNIMTRDLDQYIASFQENDFYGLPQSLRPMYLGLQKNMQLLGKSFEQATSQAAAEGGVSSEVQQAAQDRLNQTQPTPANAGRPPATPASASACSRYADCPPALDWCERAKWFREQAAKERQWAQESRQADRQNEAEGFEHMAHMDDSMAAIRDREAEYAYRECQRKRGLTTATGLATGAPTAGAVATTPVTFPVGPQDCRFYRQMAADARKDAEFWKKQVAIDEARIRDASAPEVKQTAGNDLQKDQERVRDREQKAAEWERKLAACPEEYRTAVDSPPPATATGTGTGTAGAPAGSGNAVGGGTTLTPTSGAPQKPCPTQADCEKLCAAAAQAEKDAAAAKAALEQAEADRQRDLDKANQAEKDANLQKYNRDNRISLNMEIAAQRRAYAKMLRDNSAAAVAKAKAEAEAKAKAAAEARAACDACRPCPEETKTAVKTGTGGAGTPAVTPVSSPSGGNATAGGQAGACTQPEDCKALCDEAERLKGIMDSAADAMKAANSQFADPGSKQRAKNQFKEAEARYNAAYYRCQLCKSKCPPTGQTTQVTGGAATGTGVASSGPQVNPCPGCETEWEAWHTAMAKYHDALADYYAAKMAAQDGAAPPYPNDAAGKAMKAIYEYESCRSKKCGDKEKTKTASLAVGDVNGTGKKDFIIGAPSGDPPRVWVFNGTTGQQQSTFLAFPQTFTGGVRVAVGDTNGDGKADIITGPGPGSAPRINVFSGTGQPMFNFFAYDPSFPGGVNVAAGDFDGDGKADIITGQGPGGTSEVRVFDATGQPSISFYPYGSSYPGGIKVAVGDVNGDGKLEIITGFGPGSTPQLDAFNGATGAPLGLTVPWDQDKNPILWGDYFYLGDAWTPSRVPAANLDAGTLFALQALDWFASVDSRLSDLSKTTFVPQPPADLGGPLVGDPGTQSIISYTGNDTIDVSSLRPPNQSLSQETHTVAQSARRKQAADRPRSRSSFQLVAFRTRATRPALPRANTTSQSSSPTQTPANPESVPVEFSIVSNGKTGDGAFQIQAYDPSGKMKQIRLPDGTVLQPIKRSDSDPKPVAERHAGAAAGQLLTKQVAALCLDFIKLPPELGTLYRIAPPAVQEQFKPLRSILQAGQKLADTGKLHPDSEPKAYSTFIRQFAVWTKLENWDVKKFTEMFIQHSKKSAEVQKFQWTKEVENELLAAAPGRWRDITAVLSEAEAISKASVTKSSD